MRIGRRLFVALVAWLLPIAAQAQTYTISPDPFLTVFNDSGLKVSGACVWTYVAGTSTPATTYQTSSGTANSNPIIANGAGRFTAYLQPGTAYKFVFENTPCSSISHGTVLRTADNISGTPTSAATVDIATAMAGETISAGQCAYLSDGSGGKTAGQWYKCDSANTYSSTTNWVGLATAAITSGTTGTMRLAGSVTGLSSLSVGATYYAGSAGALTSTAPTNARKVGQADTATSLVVTGNPPLTGVALQGKQTLWVPAVAMSPTITNGATGPTVTELTAANPNLTVLSFPNGSTKNAQFAVAMPKSWNAGTITFQAYWTGTAAGAGTTIWGLQCLAAADGATIDAAFGTAQEVTDTFLAVKQAHVAAESSAVTITGAAADTYTTCQVYRKGASDTRAAASLLLGVKLYYTTNAGNDN